MRLHKHGRPREGRYSWRSGDDGAIESWTLVPAETKANAEGM